MFVMDTPSILAQMVDAPGVKPAITAQEFHRQSNFWDYSSKAMLHSILLTILICSGLNQSRGDQESLDRFVAFTRLSGYVQFFHPSNMSQDLDWDRFYWYGASKIQETNRRDVVSTLNELFRPIVGAEIVFLKPIQPQPDQKMNGQYLVYQHYGMGSTVSFNSSYKSKAVLVATTDSRSYRAKTDTLLFPELPKPGEVLVKGIHRDFYCRLPLYAGNLQNETGSYPFPEGFQFNFAVENEFARLASVMKTWNIFQHFHPYLKDRKQFWPAVLSLSLQRAMPRQDKYRFLEVLRQLTSQLNDGHAQVYPTDEDYFFCPPVQLRFIGKKLFISKVLDPETELKAGDEIQMIDGVASQNMIEHFGRFVSSSTPGGKEIAISRLLTGGTFGSILTMKVGDRIHTLKRVLSLQQWQKKERPAISHPEATTAYVDLSRVSYRDFVHLLEERADLTALILDMRERPKYNHQILSHLTLKEIQSGPWFTPQIIYPDYEKVHLDKFKPWVLPPKKPVFKGKVVFLASEQTMSYPEGVLDMVKHYKLGKIIGRPTNGANGSINLFRLPTNYSVSFTGMLVLAHDGGPQHGVGVIPDIKVTPSVEALKENRDEDLEAALDWINEN